MSIRALYPTDLLALTLFSGRARPNEVITRESLCHPEARNLPPIELLREWFTIRGRRYSLVAGNWGRIEGLISARRRSGRGTWEVERLLCTDDTPNLPLDLFERLTTMGTRLRVKRIFLRLPAQSPLVEAAARAGFSPYLTEALYQRGATQGASQVPSPPGNGPIRQAARGDEHNIFRLYCAVYPVTQRTQEGPTLQDWSEGRETPFTQEFVLEGGEGLKAWIGVSEGRQHPYFELMVHPQEEALAPELVDWALGLLSGRGEVISLVPTCQTRLCQVLVEKGFQERRELQAMVKHLAVRLRLPGWSPTMARLGEGT